MDLSAHFSPIKKEMSQVERIISKALRTSCGPQVRAMRLPLLKSKGKRLRPAFVILCAYASLGKRAVGSQREMILNTAAAFELIHMATLVHDDVIDKSNLRHSKKTLNALFGDDLAICLGDQLFSDAMMLLSKTNDPKLLFIGCKAISEVCEGQMLQLLWRGKFSYPRKQYMKMIKKKTSALFLGSALAGSFAAGSEKSSLEKFGSEFGTSFQIIDDYLDLFADSVKLGKRPGENLDSKEITLPLIMLLESLPLSERKKLIKVMEKKKSRALVLIQALLKKHKILQKIRSEVSTHHKKALAPLHSLKDSSYKKALRALLEFSMSRLPKE